MIHPPYFLLTRFARLRRLFRASEAWLILLAIAIGAIAGLLTLALGDLILSSIQTLLWIAVLRRGDPQSAWPID